LKGKPTGSGRRSPHQVMHMHSVVCSASTAENEIASGVTARRQ